VTGAVSETVPLGWVKVFYVFSFDP